jgi:hypothetical protein
MLLALEKRDPNAFLVNLVSSKKRELRVNLRLSPALIITPSAGIQGFSWSPRAGVECGRLAFPSIFLRSKMSEKAMILMLSDFRFDTTKLGAGMDLMNSDTFIAGLMRIRWDFRKKAKDVREKACVYTDLNERLNFRRIYEVWINSALEGAKKLFYKNYQLSDEVMCKYFDLPEGVERLRK